MRAAIGYGAITLGAAACVLGIVTIAGGLYRRPAAPVAHRAAVRVRDARSPRSPRSRRWSGRSSRTTSRSRTSPTTSRARHPGLYTFTAAWSALEGSILLWALALTGYLAFTTWRFRARAADPLVAWATHRRARRRAVLLRADARPGQSVQGGRRHDPARRPRPEPAAAEPSARRVPPADAVPRLRRLHDPVLVRGRRAHHRPLRRRLARRRAPHDARRLGLPHGRHRARRLVELRGARVGRLLGLGPGRERVAAAVAHRDRVHPLGDGAGTARDAARLEPVARARDVLPHDPRHVPHAFRRRHVGAQLHAVADRAVAADVPRCRRDRLRRAHRVARRRAAHRRAASTRRCRARPRSCSTTCCSPRSRWSCSRARCSRCSPRRCRTGSCRSASRTSSGSACRSGSRCCSSWRSARCCRGAPRAASCCASACSIPAWAGGITLVVALVLGARGIAQVLTFALAAFAFASIGRTDRRRRARPPARARRKRFRSRPRGWCARTRGCTAGSSCTSASS